MARLPQLKWKSEDTAGGKYFDGEEYTPDALQRIKVCASIYFAETRDSHHDRVTNMVELGKAPTAMLLLKSI